MTQRSRSRAKPRDGLGARVTAHHGSSNHQHHAARGGSAASVVRDEASEDPSYKKESQLSLTPAQRQSFALAQPKINVMLFHPPSSDQYAPEVKHNNIRVKSFDLSLLLPPCRWFLCTSMPLWSLPCLQTVGKGVPEQVRPEERGCDGRQNKWMPKSNGGASAAC